MNLVSQLEINLDEQNQIYNNLFHLLQTERDYLLASDIENINKAASLKDALLREAQKKEEERLSICRRLKMNLQIVSDEEPKLLELAVRLPEPHKKRLINYRKKFETILADINSQNRDNSRYTQTALNTINGTLDTIREALQGGKTYQSKGKFDQKKEQQTRLISKSV